MTRHLHGEDCCTRNVSNALDTLDTNTHRTSAGRKQSFCVQLPEPSPAGLSAHTAALRAGRVLASLVYRALLHVCFPTNPKSVLRVQSEPFDICSVSKRTARALVGEEETADESEATTETEGGAKPCLGGICHVCASCCQHSPCLRGYWRHKPQK